MALKQKARVAPVWTSCGMLAPKCYETSRLLRKVRAHEIGIGLPSCRDVKIPLHETSANILLCRPTHNFTMSCTSHHHEPGDEVKVGQTCQCMTLRWCEEIYKHLLQFPLYEQDISACLNVHALGIQQCCSCCQQVLPATSCLTPKANGPDQTWVKLGKGS